MSATAQMIVHSGGVRRTLDELATLATPLPTPTWRPVAHYDLARSLIDSVEGVGLQIRSQSFATSGKDDARIFGVLDIDDSNLDSAKPDFSLALGFRGSNDKSLAIEAIVAARVFVCDNLAFSGSGGEVLLTKKHTPNLDLATAIPNAVSLFLEKSETFKVDIGRMKEIEISDQKAKSLILDGFVHARRMLPVHLMSKVYDLYLHDEEQRAKFPERTLWSLNNAATEAVKVLKPAAQDRYGRRIGRYFGTVLRKAIGKAGLPAPSAN